MYAIIRAGGKQQKVAPGDVIEVERLKEAGDTVELTPLLVVADDGTVSAGRAALGKAKVTAEVLGEAKGDKLHIMKFRNKTGYRRRAGHRQRYSTIRISDISLAGTRGAGTSEGSSSGASTRSTEEPAKKTTAKKPTAKRSTAKKSTAKKSTTKKTTAKKTAGGTPATGASGAAEAGAGEQESEE